MIEGKVNVKIIRISLQQYEIGLPYFTTTVRVSETCGLLCRFQTNSECEDNINTSNNRTITQEMGKPETVYEPFLTKQIKIRYQKG